MEVEIDQEIPQGGVVLKEKIPGGGAKLENFQRGAFKINFLDRNLLLYIFTKGM